MKASIHIYATRKHFLDLVLITAVCCLAKITEEAFFLRHMNLVAPSIGIIFLRPIRVGWAITVRRAVVFSPRTNQESDGTGDGGVGPSMLSF